MAGMSSTNGLPQQIFDFTLQRILPNLVDNVNQSNIFWGRAFAKPETWEGVAIWSNLTTQNNTTGGSYSGMDQVSTEQQNNTVKMQYHPAAYAQPVAIGGLQAAINGTNRGKAISIVTQKMDEAKVAASYNLGTQIYGLGTGKDIDGLGVIDDNNTTTSSYGDLTRSSNPGVNAQVLAVANGQITLDYLSSIGDNTSAAGNLESYLTIMVMQKAVWTDVEGILQVMLGARYETTQTRGYNRVSGGVPIGISVHEGDARLGGAAGFESISYRNRPLVADDQAGSGIVYVQNEYWLRGSRLLQEDLTNISTNLAVMKSPGEQTGQMPAVFQWRDFMNSYNQNGKLGILFFAGNYYCTQPRRQGQLTGITGN